MTTRNPSETETPSTPSVNKSNRTRNFSQKHAGQENFHRPPKQTVNSSCQTEIVLNLFSDGSIKEACSNIHAHAYCQLEELRESIKNTMDSVGGSVYDMLAYKDIMLQLTDRIPNAPLVDLLLITSKLYRHCGDLSRLLQTFFQIVFSDGYTDEVFHFTDVRLMKMELKQLRKDIAEMQIKKDICSQKYEDLSKGITEHAQVVEVLENRNDVLELRCSGLEEQVALLFSQITDDLLLFNEEQYQKISVKQDVEEKMTLTRCAFNQYIDDIQKRLEMFQEGLSENSKISENDFKAKAKQLNTYVPQIISRFTAVKDGLFQTSEDLLAALRDKKRILNFSIQHIKLFDLQNTKLRNCRALMHEMRQRLSVLERAVTHTFTATTERITTSGKELGGIYVDTNGVITICNDSDDVIGRSVLSSSNLQHDCHIDTSEETKSTLRQSYDGETYRGRASISHADTCQNTTRRLKSIKELRRQIVELQEVSFQITATLDTTNEQKNMLKVISLATPSTPRNYGQYVGDNVALTRQETCPLSLLTSLPEEHQELSHYGSNECQVKMEMENKSFLPFVDCAETGDEVRDRSSEISHVTRSSNRQTERRSFILSHELAQLRNDFTKKMEFMRVVYDEHISVLESRIDNLNAQRQKRQKKKSQKRNDSLFQGISQYSSSKTTTESDLSDTIPIGGITRVPSSGVENTANSLYGVRENDPLSSVIDDIMQDHTKEAWIKTNKEIFGTEHTEAEQTRTNNSDANCERKM